MHIDYLKAIITMIKQSEPYQTVNYLLTYFKRKVVSLNNYTNDGMNYTVYNEVV